MISNNSLLYLFKILAELGQDIIFFPIWWYTVGLINFSKSLLNFLANQQKSLALFVWIKNIFKPMYGQADWQGKLISFFIRVIQIIFRSIVLLAAILIAFVLLVWWLLFPPFVIYQIIFQML